MKSADLIRLLELNGWKVVSVKGSHHKLRHPDFNDPIIVPHPKKDLKIGLVSKIRKQAGL